MEPSFFYRGGCGMPPIGGGVGHVYDEYMETWGEWSPS